LLSRSRLSHRIRIGFNQIDLPQYSSYDKLRQQLLLAINEGGEGFGFS
jgi:E3 ubiquitin-protein ligase HUWE1